MTCSSGFQAYNNCSNVYVSALKLTTEIKEKSTPQKDEAWSCSKGM